MKNQDKKGSTQSNNDLGLVWEQNLRLCEKVDFGSNFEISAPRGTYKFGDFSRKKLVIKFLKNRTKCGLVYQQRPHRFGGWRNVCLKSGKQFKFELICKIFWQKISFFQNVLKLLRNDHQRWKTKTKKGQHSLTMTWD